MDTVVFEGTEFVKASVLAKKFHYTSDYLGQLCRAKKIDARLVGRTWFVNPESVAAHKKNKRQKVSVQPESQSIPEPEVVKLSITNEIKPSRKIVLPVVKNKTIKATNDLATKVKGVETRSLKVFYEKDDETLYPKLIKKKVGPPKTIRIEQADAKKIKVSGGKAEASFKANELPEVSLSGNLEITSYPEPQIEPEGKTEPVIDSLEKKPHLAKKTYKNIDISDKPDNENKEKVKKVDKDTVNPGFFDVKMPSGKTQDNSNISSEVKKDSEAKKEKTVLTAASEDAIKVAPIVSPVQYQEKTSTIVLASPLLATLIAFLCVLFIFSASTKVIVFDSVYRSQIILQVANLLEILHQ